MKALLKFVQDRPKWIVIFLLFVSLSISLFFYSERTRCPTANWPSIDRGEDAKNLDPSRLSPASVTTEINPYGSILQPFDFYVNGDFLTGQLRPGVMSHHYGNITVAGHYHGSGTYVYYLPDEDAFYLWGDDYMGHIDGMVGPFRGDPRCILPQAISNG